jgi:hypothetical protein
MADISIDHVMKQQTVHEVRYLEHDLGKMWLLPIRCKWMQGTFTRFSRVNQHKDFFRSHFQVAFVVHLGLVAQKINKIKLSTIIFDVGIVDWYPFSRKRAHSGKQKGHWMQCLCILRKPKQPLHSQVWAWITIYVCMYFCLYVCMFVCMYAWIYVFMHVCMFVRMYVCTYLYIFACMYVCMHGCMYVCVYVCMYVNKSIYIYGCACDFSGHIWTCWIFHGAYRRFFLAGGTTLDEKHFPSGREGSKGISIPRMAGRWPGPTGRIFPVCFKGSHWNRLSKWGWSPKLLNLVVCWPPAEVEGDLW